MKSTPPPPISRDLSEHPGDEPMQRLHRVADQAQVPGANPRKAPTHVVAAELHDPTEEDVERVRIMREAAYEKLAPKKITAKKR